MTFVFEKLDQQAAAALISLVRYPVYQFQRWQVIDRDRDIILVDLGGDGEFARSLSGTPSYFNLLWKTTPIAFSCRFESDSTPVHSSIQMEIENIEFPLQLELSIEECKQAIRESLEVYFTAQKNRGASVRVRFPRITFYA